MYVIKIIVHARSYLLLIIDNNADKLSAKL